MKHGTKTLKPEKKQSHRKSLANPLKNQHNFPLKPLKAKKLDPQNPVDISLT